MVSPPKHAEPVAGLAEFTRPKPLPGSADHLSRRGFLSALGVGTLVGVGGVVAWRVPGTDSAPRAGAAPVAGGVPNLAGNPGLPISGATSAFDVPKVAPRGLVSGLPGAFERVAWTVDDGTDSAVVGAYLAFAQRSGVRLTFFPNGVRPSWTEHAATLRPMVESGQVQLGNHTWSHPDLRRLGDRDVADEITRNEKFLNDTYGVSGRPFLRPPFGFHNSRVNHIAAELGYTTITTWYGSLSDSGVLSPEQILTNAREWMTAGRIVLGHANHPGVTSAFDQILEVIHERNLRTVTLNDVFLTS